MPDPSSNVRAGRRRPATARWSTPPVAAIGKSGTAELVYRPRRPTDTPLYPVVQHHLETFLATAEDEDPAGWGDIHPFPDGNGRIARFLMNVMLASGRYPWTVIRTDERSEYMSALDAASVDQEIGPFAAEIGPFAALVARAVSRAVEEFK